MTISVVVADDQALVRSGFTMLLAGEPDIDVVGEAGNGAGASGFLLKDTHPVELLNAVRVVAAGDALISPRITRRLIEEFARRSEPGTDVAATAALAQLTDREREVLELVAKGRSNAEIAAELYVSHATVKTHVSRLLMKLDARDRAQLVMIAYETGVASPGGG
jgi:DNA-binding NarL/FixJ family response regulator